MRSEYLMKENMLKTLSLTIRKDEWEKWEKAYPEIISSLVFIYRQNNQLIDAESVLSDWILRNPSDSNAKKILQEVRLSK